MLFLDAAVWGMESSLRLPLPQTSTPLRWELVWNYSKSPMARSSSQGVPISLLSKPSSTRRSVAGRKRNPLPPAPSQSTLSRQYPWTGGADTDEPRSSAREDSICPPVEDRIHWDVCCSRQKRAGRRRPHCPTRAHKLLLSATSAPEDRRKSLDRTTANCRGSRCLGRDLNEWTLSHPYESRGLHRRRSAELDSGSSTDFR
jgi:hypothetical protein